MSRNLYGFSDYDFSLAGDYDAWRDFQDFQELQTDDIIDRAMEEEYQDGPEQA